MALWPVIGRELREESRRRAIHGLRLLGAGAAMALTAWSNPEELSPGQGGMVIALLHLAIFAAVWIIGPLLTADCLSRERREGTLNLLFLTPLEPTQVVVAKALAHTLRGLTFGLSTIPVLMIAFLLGGVGWREAVVSLLTNFSSLCVALGAGLLASAANVSRVRALVWAGVLVSVSALLYAALVGLFVGLSIRPALPGFTWGSFIRNLPDAVLAVTSNFRGEWQWILSSLPASTASRWVGGTAMVAVVAVLWLYAMVLLAARTLRRVRLETPPPKWQQEAARTFCTPRFAPALFRRWLRRTLERNPMGWLERRAWTGRLMTWGWLAVLIIAYSIVLSDFPFRFMFPALQSLLGWLLVFGVAAAAAGSFRRERETGVLELVLVSTLNERQIIGGRLRGLLGQFLPAAALWVGVRIYLDQLGMLYAGNVLRRGLGLEIATYAVAAVALAVIGLYFSLQQRHYLGALLWTLLVGLAFPACVPRLMSVLEEALLEHGLIPMVQYPALSPTPSALWTMAAQLGPAALFGGLLHLRLVKRDFAFQR